MAGLNGIAGALNAAAGFGKGLMQGQELKRQQALADEDRAFQVQQRGRQQQQWSREDAVSAALEKADEAGRTAYLSAINGQPAQPEQRQGAVDNYLTSGGSDGSMPDQSKLDGFNPATAPVTQQAKPAQPAKDDRSALLAGMTARARALAEHAKAAPGVSNEWLKTHNDAMTLRGQMRLEALDSAEAKWRATGDPSHMRDAYNLLDDGFTAEDITRTPDGKIRITRVNNKTGEKVVNDATEEQFQKGVNFLRDPKATRQQEAKAAMQDELQQWMLRRIAEQGLNQTKVQEIRNTGQVQIQGLMNGGKLEQIGTKGEIDERIARLKADVNLKEAGIRVQGSMAVAQMRSDQKADPSAVAEDKLRAKDAAAARAQHREASEALALLDTSESLLSKATSSYGGHMADRVLGSVGVSTQGSQAAAQLKALEGALIAKMPKMSGPQSDKDVEMYRQMAARIGDPTTPAGDRRAAIQVVREIQQRAKISAEEAGGVRGAARSGAAPAAPTSTPAAPGAPKVGTVSKGHVYLGGDPSSPSSWRKQ